MSRLVNLVGERFGMLYVVKREGRNSSKHTTWKCLCDCGNYTVATSGNLKYGHTKSCGCLKRRQALNHVDIAGKKFARLTAIKVDKRENGICFWLCKCSCGNNVVVRYGHLQSGHTLSCGCLRIEKSREIAYRLLAGKKKVAKNGTLPKRVSKDGYVRVHDRNHKRATKCGFVLEHIKVMEEHIGRDLLPHENVHHLNGDRSDNRIENLELWSKSQPCGQRVSDKATHYLSFLNEYRFSVEELETEDLEKAKWYIEREIERRKRERTSC